VSAFVPTCSNVTVAESSAAVTPELDVTAAVPGAKVNRIVTR
jgi:hypothetical protein